MATKKKNEEQYNSTIQDHLSDVYLPKTTTTNGIPKNSIVGNDEKGIWSNASKNNVSIPAYKNTATTTTETNANTVVTPKYTSLPGVDDAVTQKMNSSFAQSGASSQADAFAKEGLDYLSGVVNEDIVSQQTKNKLNKTFKTPSAVTQADAWLSSQLKTIQSGKTSYSSQVNDMMNQIMGREKFSYDVDTDPLFQQALASAMNSGKQAMQDTIGQASALTGGYGSTYATTAGNQAYNSFVEGAYDDIAQYYQLALDKYQMEGDEMYRQLGMLTDADDREYNRNITAYDATYTDRNRKYDESYNLYRDNKTDAFAMANLEMNEHGQKVSDATNYYNATSNYADSLYGREYTQWSDSVNQAFQMGNLQNSNYWNQTNFDEGVRQYEKNFAEDQRQFDQTYAQNEDHFTRNLDFQASENAKNRAASASRGSGGPDDSGSPKEPSSAQMKEALDAYNNGGMSEFNKYVDSLPSNVDATKIADYVFGYSDENGDYVSGYGESWWEDYDNLSNWTISNDTKNGGFLWWKGDDHDDSYIQPGNGTPKTFDELKKDINASNMPQERKDELLDKLKKQSKK